MNRLGLETEFTFHSHMFDAVQFKKRQQSLALKDWKYWMDTDKLDENANALMSLNNVVFPFCINCEFLSQH